MVFIKRKPIVHFPLPSLSDVLQPVHPTQEVAASSPHPSSSKGDVDSSETAMPPDGKDDEEQFQKLLTVFKGEYPGAQGTVGSGKGKRAGTRVIGSNSHSTVAPLAPNGKVNGVNGHDTDQEDQVLWRIWDRECYIIPQTGEIFTDYEAFIARMTFYQQPAFQCEVSGKTSLNYFSAQNSEAKEARQLHTRFPRQLKRAVLTAVQFQIEGKLETLADKLYERFVNRFFDDECVFVDVEGDKYLARIVKTFPPRSLAASSSTSPAAKSLSYHPFAADLNITTEEANEKDDPMGYFYNVRLIEEGAAEGTKAEYGENGDANGSGDDVEQWQGSTMEVQADKISRDRINFSRIMLKRFIRDCVVRDPAVYSPWMIKSAIAARYNISTEMPEEVRDRIHTFREKQMDKRKRDREERLGITHEDKADATDGEEKPKTKKQKLEEAKRLKKEEEEREREEAKKKKPMKYPAEDLLVEYETQRDEPAGRIEVKPKPNRSLPFGDEFEKFLMSWSFLNVMGKALNLSPFTLDDFEHALYHNDPWTSPTPLMIEIHSTLLNCLIGDFTATNETIKPLLLIGKGEDNDMDYWQGKKGATTELLRPAAMDYATTWKNKLLSNKEHRKGWEGALVGCLWERATLEVLPNYLDNILHLTFEDKPAPTRPTWSTAPATAASGVGLIPSKPEKRYSTLHHIHKLDIIAFLIDMVAQTGVVRDFLEKSTLELTEVRKDIIEVRREQKALRAAKDALDPSKQKKEEPAEGANGEGDGDVSMSVKEERNGSPELSLVNGHANGNGTISNGTEHDELASTRSSREDGDDDADSDSLSDTDIPEDGPAIAAASRRKAMQERAAEREAEEAMRLAKVAQDKVKAKELKLIAGEKRRIQDELDIVHGKLRQLDHDFRSHMYTLRARPLGVDRFCNKIWWLDGLGSAPLTNEQGKILWGTGRLYLQGSEDLDLEFCRGPAEITEEDLEVKRAKEEGEGRLKPGEWAMYDTVDNFQQFVSWLNPRGVRESALLKSLHMWMPELEGGIRKRRQASGLDNAHEAEETVRRNRPVRKVAASGDDETAGYMGWKNKRAV